MRLLVDLSHAAAGYVGVAQDLRLIFAMLCDIEGLDVSGLLMPAGRHDLPRLRPGQADAAAMTAAVLHTMERNWDAPRRRPFPFSLLQRARMASQVLRRDHALLPVDPVLGEAIWRVLFARTLAPSQRHAVLAHRFYATDLSVASVIDRAVHPPVPLHKRLLADDFDAVFFCMPRPVRLPPGVRQIMRFHDAVPVTDTDTVSEWRMGLAHSRLVRACDPAAVFVCNSPQSRDNLLALDPSRAAHAVVIPCAVAPPSAGAGALDIGAVIERHVSFRALGAGAAAPAAWQRPAAGMRYVLGVSTLEPRKNFAGLVRGWERAGPRIGEDVRLVIVGGSGWREEEVLAQMRPGVASGRILHVQNLPQDELQALMRGAACFALPSFNEGFGYAPLEAMQLGTPCVVSDIPVFRWIFGDTVTYADPHDIDSIAIALQRQLAAGRRSGPPDNEAVMDRFRPGTVRTAWASLMDGIRDGHGLGQK
jgi:glycosyltransferase involved in cell wall biosynthesis